MIVGKFKTGQIKNLRRYPNLDETKVDYYKIYESIWRNMERENTLISYRAGWCIFFTGGIFAAETIATNVMLRYSSNSTFVQILVAVTAAVSVFAAIVCNGSAKGVNAALYQIDELRKHYSQFRVGNESILEKILLLPRPFGDDIRHLEGHSNAKLFPKALCIFWTILSILQAGLFFALISGIADSAVFSPNRSERPRKELGASPKASESKQPKIQEPKISDQKPKFVS